jgi:ADP-heptose:LPS heptosyltransferase
LLERVELIHGLSVPRALLPCAEVIREKLVESIVGDGIYVDHDAAVRTQRYYAETDFQGIPDDRLGHCIEDCDSAPDFVLLDSGGHMGNIEFNYLLDRLTAPCYIALDDVNHVKHRRSFQQILKDPRFTLTVEVPEKFGFCIAHFTPTSAGGPMQPTRLLWIRTDAIGDNVLSLPALSRIREANPTAWVSVLCQEGLAEIYSACPFVDEVLTFDLRRAHEDLEYRQTIVKLLRGLRANICINPVLSREKLTDLFALGSRAEARVAFDGNDCNISTALRLFHNQFYTKIVDTVGHGLRSEFLLNEVLLRALDISAEDLTQQIWLTDDDEAFARRFMTDEGLDPGRTLTFFPGAKDSHRLSQAYGGALEHFCGSRGFAVVTLGSSRDREIIQSNVAGRNFRVVDLAGKTTIRQAAAVIARCALAVGAETGLAHIAAAVGTPHVVLLGGGHFGRFMPSAATTTAVALPLECYDCNWFCRYQEHYCVKGVTEIAIVEALRLTIASRADRPRLVLLGPSYWPQQAGLPAWADVVVSTLDHSVSVTTIERDGTVRRFDRDAVPDGRLIPSVVSHPNLKRMDYETLLAQYGMYSEVNPLRRAFYAFMMRSLTGKSVAEIVQDNVAYFRTWVRSQRR